MELDKKTIKSLQGIIIKYWDAGYSKVLGRFYGMINFILIGLTYLTLQGIIIDFSIMLLLFIAMIILIFVLGIIYVKGNFLKAEQSALFLENPEFVDLKKEVLEIKELLKSKK